MSTCGKIILENNADEELWSSYKDNYRNHLISTAESVSEEYYDGDDITLGCLLTHTAFGFT